MSFFNINFSLKIAVIAAVFAAALTAGPVPTNKPAHYPDWWFERDVIPRLPAHATNPAPVWPDHYPAADDYAAANLGQLKTIATAAAAEFDATLPAPGAGATITALVSSWQSSPAPGVTRDDFAALNQGQLKAVATPFYVRLTALGYQGPPLASGEDRPWTGTTADDDGYALVNLGQLKHVLNFDPVRVQADGDGDDLPDAWERIHFGNLNQIGSTDTDKDGLTNLEEFGHQTNPDKFSTGDSGVSDGWAIEHGFDPLTHDFSADFDEDALSDYEEAMRGTDPRLADTDGDGMSDDLDGWPLHDWISLPRLPETNYAVVSLPGLNFPTATHPSYLDDKLNVLGLSNESFRLWRFATNQNIEPPLKPAHAFQLNRPLDFPFLNFGRYLFPLLRETLPYSARAFSRNGLIVGIVPDEFGGMVAASWAMNEEILTTFPHSGTTAVSIGLSVNSLGVLAGWESRFASDGSSSGGVLLGENSWIGGAALSLTEHPEYAELSGELVLPVEINDHGDIFANIYGSGDLNASFDWVNPENSSVASQTAVFDQDGRHDLGAGQATTMNNAAPAVVVGFDGLNWWAHKQGGAWTREDMHLWNRTLGRFGAFSERIRAMNDRHELITGGHVIRNGELYPIKDYVGAGWTAGSAKDINNHGVILAHAKRTLDLAGQPIPPASQVTEPVLLVPVDLTISHPLVTSPEPPEYIVSADSPTVLLTAHITGAADGSLVGWEIETGDGTLSHTESATVDGFAQTSLTTSTVAGDIYRVTARVKKLIFPALNPSSAPLEFDFEALGIAATDASLRQTTGDITVIPGFAAAITVARETSGGDPATTLPADAKSSLTLVATIRDALGQPVVENTPVTWHLTGLGKLESVEDFTDADGIARAVLVAGAAIADQKIRIEADSFEIVETVPNVAATGSLTPASTNLDLSSGNATTTLTITVPEALNGAEVRWFTSLGRLENPSSVIATGQATASLRAVGGRVGTAIVTASVGGALYLAEVAFTTTAPIAVEVEHPVIVGDASADGTHAVPRADGTVENVAYRASTPVRIRAPAYAGHTATVRFGKMMPATSLLYRFDQLVGSTTPAETVNHPATVSGATLDTAHPHEGAASLFFDGAAAVVGVPDHAAARLQPGLAISLWVHAVDSGGGLVAKTGEYDLSIDPDGRLRFTVQTTAGAQTLVGPVVPLDRWVRVRAEYQSGGRLRLGAGDHVVTTTVLGEPQPGSALVLVGEDFGGWLDRLAFEAGEQFVAGSGLSVQGVDGADQVVLDSNGEAIVTLAGNGGSAVSSAQPVLGVGITVSINPEITVQEGVLVTTRENYAVLDATLGGVRVSTGGGTGPLSDARRAEILAACLRQMETTGQRAAALPFAPTGSLAERQQFGFRAILWMQQTGQAVPLLRITFENTEALALTPDQRRFFEDSLTEMLIDAIRFGSDPMTEYSLIEKWGGFLDTLAQLSQGADFPAIVLAADNHETFEDLGKLHEDHGPELIGELVRLGQLEATRNPTFIQRVAAGLMKAADVVTGEWEQQIITSTENWLRERTMLAVAEGKLDEVDAYYIGFAWGLCNEAFTMGQMTNQFAARRMMEQLAGTVVAAWNGSDEARTALKTMIPVYGLTVMNDSTRALAEQGQYFDAGMGSAQETTGVVGTATGAGQLMKAGTVAIIVKKAGKTAVKRGPPPLPASFGVSKSPNPTRATFSDEVKRAYPQHFPPNAAPPAPRMHHAVPVTTIEALSGRLVGPSISASEMHSLANARLIPHDLRMPDGRRLHQHITNKWAAWFDNHPTFTKQQLLDHATHIDDLYGDLFIIKIR